MTAINSKQQQRHQRGGRTMSKIESRRTITAMVRTQISPDGLDPYLVEVLPDATSIAGTRNDSEWTIEGDEAVTLYAGDGEKILEMLPDEARDVALGILHALYVAGHLAPAAIEDQIRSWMGQEWNGTTEDGIFFADAKNNATGAGG